MANTSKLPPQAPRPVIDMSIDWESLPSLKSLVTRREAGSTTAPVWSDTLPFVLDAALGAATLSELASEPLPGMIVREVTEPDVFKAFFGPQGRTPEAP
jgi:hypothetical protein